MLRKLLKFGVISITLFCFEVVYAYEFIDSSNESLVRKRILEIYNMKDQYEDLVGSYEERTVEIFESSSTTYWWPIGSNEIVESDGKIYAKGDPAYSYTTSSYGYREDPFHPGHIVFHSGMDISGGTGEGELNIIAARDGVVVYPTADVESNCQFSSSQSTCGGGYGNYVIIQHSDGNFTLYAHLYANSITVKAGDSVEQGQVIAKIGSSGNSTGVHLHFEVREGQNAYSATVDPANYISLENARIVTKSIGGTFIDWLTSWEGHTQIDGDSYVVADLGDGVRTVGSGVTLENNIDKFAQYGIDINDYPVGSKMPIETVDQIKLELVEAKRSYIESSLSVSSITLAEHEIEALISQMYNTGNINGFANAYVEYGNTEALYDNWFFRNVMQGTQFEKGLTRRRNSEWALFHDGIYVYN